MKQINCIYCGKKTWDNEKKICPKCSREAIKAGLECFFTDIGVSEEEIKKVLEDKK